MFSFEGEYRKKPVQAFGGASKSEPKELLLQRAQEDRRKREKLKQQLNSVVKIQAWYRSSKVRRNIKHNERREFDLVCAQLQKTQVSPVDGTYLDLLSGLSRQLSFFYNVVEDEQRLTWLCWQLVKHKQSVIDRILLQDNVLIHQIQRILKLCCRYIDVVASAQPTQLAMPMRMLEIYTDPTLYKRSTTGDPLTAGRVVQQILDYLIHNDYYRSMRVLIDAKVPSSIDQQSSTLAPPTAAADTILILIRQPLSALSDSRTASGGQACKYRNIAMRTFCSTLLCPRYTEQIRSFLLPSLVRSDFPFIALLRALIPDGVGRHAEKELQGGNWTLNVEPTIWLLHAVMTLAEPKLDKLSEEEVQLYLLILYKLTPQLRYSRRAEKLGGVAAGAGGGFVAASDSSDSEEEPMQTNQQFDLDMMRVRLQCIEKLDSQSLVRCLVRLSNCNDRLTLVATATLCHSLMAENKMAVHNTRLLYSLAYNSTFLQNVWNACATISVTDSPKQSLLQMLSRGLQMSNVDFDQIVPLLSIFSSLFSHFLTSLHDSEFHGDSPRARSSMPFKLVDLAGIALMLCDACIGIILLTHPESKLTYGRYVKLTGEELQHQQDSLAYVFRVTVNLVKQLHERDCRRQFCPDNHWITKHLSIRVDMPLYTAQPALFARRPFGALSILNKKQPEDDELRLLSVMDVRNLTVLTEMPFVVPFQDRVKIFHMLAMKDKEENQGGIVGRFRTGPSIRIMVRRSHLYEDAFEKLSQENEPNLKKRMQIQLVNFAGLDEAGVDGGGIFREFMSELIKTSFDANRGFFRSTSDKLLYPNPEAKILVPDYTKHYFFLGRILGKVIYENMLTELPFASFFLSKIISREKGNVDIHHLASLDPEMYKNLLFLKDYDGDVADLGLDFTVVNNELGEAQMEELKPGGRDILVTNYNRIEYMHLMADYRLNRQMRQHCAAFRQGLADVVNIEWLTMFDHNELQVLISGAQIPIDLNDLRQHTNYAGGDYNADHPVIIMFWRVVEEFTDNQKRQLLKFVTSCSRPPLLGFKELYPAFCIQFGGKESDRLPTASTCMNLLKLPEFQDEKTLRQKLVYAIEAGAGFELS